MNNNLLGKVKESLTSVLPITIIVLLLHVTIAPLPGGILALFLVGSLLLILGMGLFTLGADIAMMPMGERIGSQLTQSRKLWLLILVSFLIGVIITVAEPDLQVLARQVPAVPDMVLILAVALGVGFFLVLALLRIVFGLHLSWMLVLFYGVVFGLAAFTSEEFVTVAFDSGGVTTGPITVPFILALGVGVAAVRGGHSSHNDSFGLVALSSVGPILAVLIMGMFYDSSASGYGAEIPGDLASVSELIARFAHGFPEYFRNVGIALLPILAFFLIFQVFWLKLPVSQLIKMMIGLLYTYVGLAVFLTAVNVGFMPAGHYLGAALASLPYKWVLLPVGMVVGFFIVTAEPAVHVLNKQVEEVSGGAITRRAMLMGLSIGVSISLGLAMVRVLTGLSIWWVLVPGYLLSLALTFFVPPIYTAIAFDSGGVASGPMTATFLLPLSMGACEALGGNLLTDAFGIVAMVAMTPLITIQILGLFSEWKNRRLVAGKASEPLPAEEEIIDL